jgi:hypothetical protein
MALDTESRYYAEFNYAVSRMLRVAHKPSKQSDVTLNGIMPSVFMLNVVAPSVLLAGGSILRY